MSYSSRYDPEDWNEFDSSDYTEDFGLAEAHFFSIKQIVNDLTVMTGNSLKRPGLGFSEPLRVSGLTSQKPRLSTNLEHVVPLKVQELSPFSSANSTPYSQDNFNVFPEPLVYSSPTRKKTREVNCDVVVIEPHRLISTECCWMSTNLSPESQSRYGECLEFTDCGTYIEYTSSPVTLEPEYEVEKYWIRLKTTDSFRKMLYMEKEYSNLDKIVEADWRIGIDIILQLTQEFNFHIETVFHATSYFIQCLTNCAVACQVGPRNLAIASFVIAGKSCEEELDGLIHRTYEKELLKLLDWSTSVITPYMILAELVSSDVMELLLDFIEKCWLIAVVDWRFLEFSASVLTISALSLVTEEKGIDLEFGEVWSVDWNQIELCTGLLRGVKRRET
ncbi:hypothetical protein K493DRAFT_375401 [Basidiobolus meristosporus CBS 931.73]|uniref:Uncharacterized protein n=1 Tax=Basidiobolus meristosporus CBS 931.73 TaxID=1314790 RepID=A0A1Y1Z6V2_9FUNG|nr:hypothetical protein K493DRAFT_375401 [Basidiobolus meristosporus CBS 931.73]|eukprot:ORY05535.1 hypothetical protein K493DRAFT_375401 [Basidiobolus meristosporus CBS 931.73]